MFLANIMCNENQLNLTAGEGDKGIRLDKYLATHLDSISRSRIKVLIENNNITLSDKTINDCSYRVKPGDEFAVNIPPVEDSHMQANDEIKLDIAYEDENFMVINKQAGLTVHPGAGNINNTMANALMAYCGDNLSGIGGVARPGIVHRLDKDTSGLILVAKNDMAHQNLSEQISTRTMSRKYLAVCWGVPKPHSGTIESNIGRNPKNRLKMAIVDSGGKHAVTHYTVKKIYGGGIASLVECKLQTGRTHQIRVHMTENGHPLIGDPLYASKINRNMKKISDELREFLKGFNRQALHSFSLGIENPADGSHMEFESTLPDDMAELVKLLESN